jgi:hypothetical protein
MQVAFDNGHDDVYSYAISNGLPDIDDIMAVAEAQYWAQVQAANHDDEDADNDEDADDPGDNEDD